MIGGYNCLCKLEITTSVIELNLVHGVNGKAWWNSNAFINVPKASLNVTEYVKTLSEGKLHFFRTASETPGNPYGTGSCLFMIYIINRASNGIGISINHSTTVYYLRLAEGKITYSAL